MADLKLILGGPGCGKTTRLLQIVGREIDEGVEPSEIAFVAFTKAAANDARHRAAERFHVDEDEDLPWFRTIHSLAYKMLELTREEIMERRDWDEFSELIGYSISGAYETDVNASVSLKQGDRYLRVVDYASTTMSGLEDAYHAVGLDLDWWSVKRFDKAFQLFKESIAKLDFTDILISYLNEGGAVPVRVAIIDEAQDLTAAQWAVARKAFANAERIYIGGDDDQAIYRWAGADVNQFLNLSVAPEVLEFSYRLPRAVFNVGQRITSHIRHRYHKPYLPDRREGLVEWHHQLDSVPLGEEKETSWLLLARNGYMLERLEEFAITRGIPYARRDGPVVQEDEAEAIGLFSRLRSGRMTDLSAHEARVLYKALGRPRPALRELDRYGPDDLGIPMSRSWYRTLDGIPKWRLDFYLECLQNGEDLTSIPRVRIETIHGVKGAEADKVLLLLDVSFRTAESYEADPDHEHRVFYVGATRARDELHVLAPQTRISYPGLL